MTLLAKAAVAAAPYGIDKPYDYRVPAELRDKVLPGIRVMVPFGRGNRLSEAMVLLCAEGEPPAGCKAIASVLDEAPVLTEDGIALASFLRQRCYCTMYEAVRTVLPAGLWFRRTERCALAEGLTWEEALAKAGKTPLGRELLHALSSHGGSADLAELRQEMGEGAAAAAAALRRKGILTLETGARRRLQDKTHRLAELSVPAEEAEAEARRRERKSPLRAAVLRFLVTAGKTSLHELCYQTGASPRTVEALAKAGYVSLTEEEVFRVPELQNLPPEAPITLNEEQQRAFARLLPHLDTRKPAAALLEGVTGSGKTEVYLRLVRECLDRGRSAMVLVPEIILTPGMMRRFASHFGESVVMLHSALRMSERYDQWKRLRQGGPWVVLGTRSAVFSPLQDLGLLILDEEQDGSYQSETVPCYHTRDVAKFLCARKGALLLLGSATPAIESAYAARQGVYQHEILRNRFNRRSLPRVEIADLRQEVRSGNPGSLSAPLRRELERNLENGEQSILFLNRRGSSRMLLCGECGEAPQCPRCSVPLTYHSANGRLMCHYCGHSERAVERCPVCGGIMKHVGVGTQRVEEELRETFPGVSILRMDADSAAGNHEALLREFESQRIPILLGTQMVAKGLDFENVTLVGVLGADLSLYVDHYRAAERTFSLLTQVVGRAGRGSREGRAVIQTYTPSSEVIRAAAEQDYARFYESEIRLRQVRRCPPFADLTLLTLSGLDEAVVLRGAVWLRQAVLDRVRTIPEVEVLGPAPHPVLRVNNRFRYRLTVVGRAEKPLRAAISDAMRDFARQRQYRDVSCFAGCNPMDA